MSGPPRREPYPFGPTSTSDQRDTSTTSKGVQTTPRSTSGEDRFRESLVGVGTFLVCEISVSQDPSLGLNEYMTRSHWNSVVHPESKRGHFTPNTNKNLNDTLRSYSTCASRIVPCVPGVIRDLLTPRKREKLPSEPNSSENSRTKF